MDIINQEKEKIIQHRLKVRNSLRKIISMKVKIDHNNDSDSLEFYKNYQVKEKLGQGGNAYVKKCIQKLTGKEYAVKFLPRLDDQLIQQIKKQYKIVKQIKDEKIVKLHKLMIQENQAFLIMQYIDYPTISQYIINQKYNQIVYLYNQKIKKIVKNIIDSVQVLHQNGICHRDLKPSNIHYNQKNDKIKIIDFGISQKFKTYKQTKNMWSGKGTLQYQAPQILIGKVYNQKVDVWSIGVITYQLIMKQNPFAANTVNQVIKNILQKQIDYSVMLKVNCSKFCIQFLKICLQKDTQKRASITNLQRSLWILTNEKNNKSVIRMRNKKSWLETKSKYLHQIKQLQNNDSHQSHSSNHDNLNLSDLQFLSNEIQQRVFSIINKQPRSRFFSEKNISS